MPAPERKEAMKMNRRTPVALAAVAALGLSVLAGGPAIAATKHKPKPKPNTIETHGNLKVKINGYIMDAQRFFPGTLTVKSGSTVTLINKSQGGAPHSLSLLKKSALPQTGQAIEECAACGPLIAAHQANPETGAVGRPVVDVGQPGFDTMGDTTTAGDSVFLAPKGKVKFQVTAAKGSTLHFFCAIHPWMQGTIKVK
jgi:plastocyanin